MTAGPAVRYPSSPITPHGAYHALHDRIPHVNLRAYDDSIVFNLMGPLAIADRMVPERVELKSMSGLIPPWVIIDQKGASQDGTSFVDSLDDPIDVSLGVKAVGRNPAHLRRVVSDLVASIDTKRQCELSWFTHRLGRWWAPVRWAKTPSDAVGGISTNVQEMTLSLRADSGFWQSYENVADFRFTYDDDSDNFDRLTAEGDPITGWTTVTSGGGSGVVFTDGEEAVTNFSGVRTAVMRHNDYTATTDSTVIEIELGTNPSWYWPPNTYVDVWARMNNTGTAGTDGIRWRMGNSSIRVSAFVSGVEIWVRDFPLWWWPGQPGEKFKFVTGIFNDSRIYRVLRNNAVMGEVKETGTASLIDASHRKAGMGFATLAGTVRPLGVRNWKVGDNNNAAQEGFVSRINVGDQPMWDRFTCFGPGTFYLGNGPGSNDMVRFGPLLTNQIMQVRTDPRHRGVIDMTAIPASPQEIALHATAQHDFFSFLFGASIRTSPAATESLFGVLPPQGNPYALLKGRFSRPVPERSPGGPVVTHHTKVKIEGGNQDSHIIVAGTPLRRLPY
jgi:hypothetical protein